MVSMYSAISSSWQIYLKIHQAVYTSFRNSPFTQIYRNIVCVHIIPQSINHFTILDIARENDLTKEMNIVDKRVALGLGFKQLRTKVTKYKARSQHGQDKFTETKPIEAGWRIHTSVNCVIIRSDSGLLTVRRQAIVWSIDILSMRS